MSPFAAIRPNRLLGGVICALLATSVPASLAGTPPTEPQDVAPAPSDAATDLAARLAALAAAGEDNASRARLIGEIIEAASTAKGASALGQQLPAYAASHPEAAAALLSGIASLELPARELGDALAAFATSEGEHPPILWRAMARFRTRTVVGALIDCLEIHASSRGPITEALVDITGRADLAPDGWGPWFESQRWVSELAWERELVRGLAAQRDQLRVARRDLVTRFVDLVRAVYLTLDAGSERSIKLSELLEDEEPAVRQLGFDLARRELLAATNAIDGSVGQALIKLLTRPEAGVRAQAAELVVHIAPPEAGEAIRRALADERDPRAAAAMLAGVARWPNPNVRGLVAAWVAHESKAAHQAAAEAALAMLRAEMLDDASRARILEALRSRGPARLGEAALRVLAIVGGPEDREAIAELLTAPDANRRRLAGAILADDPAFTTRLVDAAHADSALYGAAIRALELHRPAMTGYEIAQSLSAPDEKTRDEALARLVSAMSCETIVAMAERIPEPRGRYALLAGLVARSADQQSQSADAADAAHPAHALALGLLMLAETELSLGKPADALGVLESIPPADPPLDAQRVIWAKTAALVATNQIERINELEIAGGDAVKAPIDAWIRGLELCAGAAHAPAVLAHIRAHFENLDEETLARLDELAGKIAAHAEASSGGG